MDEVFINQEANPYVLEVDGTLDLAGLQLQPGSIVINSKKGLVDVQTSKTKRIFADIQQKVLHDTTAGSMANPLHISGAPIAGLDTGDSKLDQILSLLKAKTDPKARPISEVGSAEADSVLLDLGFLQDDGNEVDPIVVPAGLSMCHSFDYSQFPSEDDGTPALLQHHQQQLSGFEVQFGRSQFQMYDIHHRKDLKLILPSGVSYIGGLDGVAAPWGLAKAGAVSEMRIAYEHKQSSAQKQAYREANPQYYEGKVSKSGGEHTTFAGRRKGQSIVALLAACAINSYPVLLDLTDGLTHHLLQLTGTRLVSWTDLTPQQAYFKQAQWLAKPNATQRQNTLDSIPEDDALPLKKMRIYRPEAMALSQLSPEFLEDLSPAEKVARAYHVLDSVANFASPLPMPDAVAAWYG